MRGAPAVGAERAAERSQIDCSAHSGHEWIRTRICLKASRGDSAAFETFYRRHASALVTYVRGQVPTTELAFDLTAETFAKVVAALPRFDPRRGSARGWLFAIAANEVRQAWRRGQVEDRARRQFKLDPIVLDDPGLARVETYLDDLALLDALSQLPPDKRAAVESRVVEEFSYREMAVQLRCSESVARKRVSRGPARLRKIMGEAS